MLSFLGVTGEIPENLEGSVTAFITAVTNFNAANAALTVLERAGAMAVHVSLTVVVAYGIMKGQRKYLLLAILAHAAVDIFPALQQRSVVSMPVTEVWLWGWAILLVIRAGKLYKEMGRS